MTLDRLADRAEGLLEASGGRRVLLGIAGAPGAGKSTFTDVLVSVLRGRAVNVAHLPMDGFHLADIELDRLGRRDRKGAPDTFDALGYAALLDRVREGRGTTVYAPTFERDLEQPLAGAIAILGDADLVITEGNYLLCPEPEWVAVRAHLDEVWFCSIDPETRRERLIARHVRFGKQADAAAAWVRDVDEPNARAVEEWAAAADLLVSMSDVERG